MGLDVYVGSLTRYYAGEWETVIQQAARAAGGEAHVLRPGMTSDDPEIQALIDELGPSAVEEDDIVTDPAAILEAVVAWRDSIAGVLGRELEWREDGTAPYFTDKPDWDGYGSLQVLAACVEREEREWPVVAVEAWDQNEVWGEAASGSGSRFPHLYFPEVWIPVDVGELVGVVDLNGNDIAVGSSVRLLAELREINDETFRGSETELEQWRHEGAGERAGPFDVAARFGLAVFLELAATSVAEELPMRLDY